MRKPASKFLSLFLVLAMVCSLFGAAFAAEEETATPYVIPDVDGKVVILHTNDTHGADLDEEGTSFGMAGVAQLKKDFEAAGADVRVADISATRRNFVAERFGHVVMDPSAADFDMELRKWTHEDYPNKVIDSTGSKASNSTAINYLAAAGDLIFVGLQSDTLGLSDPSFHIREATVYASRVAQMQDFRWVLDQIESGNIRAERMITDVSDFAHAKESFEEWVSRGGAVFKGIIEVE